MSTHLWFDLLNESGWIREQIDSENNDRVGTVLWWLSSIAGQSPKEIARLLRSWWNDDARRTERLLDWFGYVRRGKPDDDLLILCNDVINCHPSSMFQNQGHDRFLMLLHTWAEKSPENCGQLLHSLFEAWFALNPGCNPFERERLEVIDTHSLNEIAQKAPQAFLQGTSDALVRSVKMVVAEGRSGNTSYTFNYRTYSGHRFGFDNFLGIYRSALIRVAQEDPETAAIYLDQLDAYEHQALMHLHLEAIQSNPSAFANRICALVTNEKTFDSGWEGAKWLSFALACRKSMSHLSSEEKKELEQAILNYSPEIDFAKWVLRKIEQEGEQEPFWTKRNIMYYLNRSGYIQWCILETISEELLSSFALSRLHLLRRKFPEERVEEPAKMEVRAVGSPINREQCARMKDSHWLSAMERYGTDKDRSYNRSLFNGGARELANELQEATKKNPTRFSALCFRVPDTAHHAYIEHILWGLAEVENPSDESLIQAIKRAHQHINKPFGRNIVRLIEKHPHIALDAEVLEILIWYALYGGADETEVSDAQNTDHETITIGDLMQRGGRIHIRGINGVRGSAWDTLGSLIWQVPEVADRVWDAIEIALQIETLISVRCCMIKPLAPLFNSDKERFSNFIRSLIKLPNGAPYQYSARRLSPLITRTGIHLFPYIFDWLPPLADELVSELLKSRDETIELVGAWLIFRESFRNDAYINKATELATVNTSHRRLLAQVAAGAIAWAENSHRAEALLKCFFFHDDLEVRKQAAEVFRSIQPAEVGRYRDLGAVFLQSPAFHDHGFAFLYMLENATCDVLDLVLGATQQLITDIAEKGDQHGRRSTDVHRIQSLLRREYVSSESNAEARKKILDLIDLMLFHNVYGVDSIITTHDRW